MNYIKGFDGLRAISIGFVLLSHPGISAYLGDSYFMSKRVYSLFSGTTGVQVFFAISGFLITRILLIEKQKKNDISFKNFYVRRFIRLLPALLLFYLAIIVLMYFKYVPSSKFGLIYSFGYLYNFIPNKFYTGELGHMWSLSLEEQFYLLWPFVIFFLNKWKKIVVALLIIALCIISKFFLPLNNINNPEGYMYGRWFIPGVLPIIIGSLFGLLSFYYNKKLKSLFANNKVVLITSLVLYLSPLYLPQILFLIKSFFQSIGVSLFILWIYYNQNSNITYSLELLPLKYLGKISYGVYIFQGLFLRTGPGGDLLIQQFPYNIILTIIVAVLSYHLVELKVLKLKKYFN